MAITSRGTAVLKFGTFTLAGYVVTDEELADEGESYQLEDEVGDIITDISNFGERGRQVFNFIPFSSGSSFPAVGSVFTGPNSFSGIVRRRVKTRSRKIPEAWRIECETFPGVSLA